MTGALDVGVLKAVNNLAGSQAAELIDAMGMSSGTIDTYA